MAKIRQIFTIEPDLIELLKTKCQAERISMASAVNELIREYVSDYQLEEDEYKPSPRSVRLHSRPHNPPSDQQEEIEEEEDPLEGIDYAALNKIRKANNLPPLKERH